MGILPMRSVEERSNREVPRWALPRRPRRKHRQDADATFW